MLGYGFIFVTYDGKHTHVIFRGYGFRKSNNKVNRDICMAQSYTDHTRKRYKYYWAIYSQKHLRSSSQWKKEIIIQMVFLYVLITHTEIGFKSLFYYKPRFTAQYLYSNSHNPSNVKKVIAYIITVPFWLISNRETALFSLIIYDNWKIPVIHLWLNEI